MSSLRDRLEALLIDEATGNLSVEEQSELEALLREIPGVERYAFERAASAVFLAGLAAPAKPIPEELSDRIIESGKRLLTEKG